MKAHTSSLTTITYSIVIALLLSHSTSNTLNFKAWGIGGTSLACVIGLTAFVLEFKNPQKELPKLKKQASLLEQVSYYADLIIGQKKKNKLHEDGTITKIYPRGLGVLYERFKQALPALAIFQTINKAEGSFINFVENIGLYGLLWS